MIIQLTEDQIVQAIKEYVESHGPAVAPHEPSAPPVKFGVRSHGFFGGYTISAEVRVILGRNSERPVPST